MFFYDWEQRKLSEVANHRGGTALEKYFHEDGKYKVISIGSYGLDSKYVDQNIRALSNEITDSRIVNSGELTMVLNDKTANGTIIGRSLLIENGNEYVINQRTEIISPKENFNSDFAYTILNGSFREKVKRIVQGGTQIYVNYTAVSNLTLEIPSIEEQQKIGTFFKQLDDTLALHQRKLEKLKLLKHGYLQQLFPQNSEKIPRVRFAKFENKWEQCEFSELAEIRRGLTYKPSDVQDVGVRVLRSSNISEDTFLLKSDDVFVKSEAVNIEEVRNGDILITSANGSNRLVGKHAIIDGIREKTAHGGFMLVARAENPQFTNALMSSNWYSKFINVFVSGGNGSIGNLSKTVLESQKIFVPNKDEQDKIALFFSNLDSLITLHQEKLKQLKTCKKALLQKMFI